MCPRFTWPLPLQSSSVEAVRIPLWLAVGSTVSIHAQSWKNKASGSGPGSLRHSGTAAIFSKMHSIS